MAATNIASIRATLPGPLTPPIWLAGKPAARKVELFTRFLFSALVDADFLDSAAYMARAGSADAADHSASRIGIWPSLVTYIEVLDAFMKDKQAWADPDRKPWKIPWRRRARH